LSKHNIINTDYADKSSCFPDIYKIMAWFKEFTDYKKSPPKITGGFYKESDKYKIFT